MSVKHFRCERGHTPAHALLDGYLFGDRLLEGVLFQVHLGPESGLQVRIDPPSAAYFSRLNQVMWLSEAQAYVASDPDCYSCPECGQDCWIEDPENPSSE